MRFSTRGPLFNLIACAVLFAAAFVLAPFVPDVAISWAPSVWRTGVLTWSMPIEVTPMAAFVLAIAVFALAAIARAIVPGAWRRIGPGSWSTTGGTETLAAGRQDLALTAA